MKRSAPNAEGATESAQILVFDLARVRPGLRAHLARARALIEASDPSLDWSVPEDGPGRDDLLALLPPRGGLYAHGDEGAVRIAIDASLLALWCIQAGHWRDPDLLSFFMQLQVIAERTRLAMRDALAETCPSRLPLRSTG